MKILFNDIIQLSNAHDELKSPALSDSFFTAGQTVINLDKIYPINAVGIGNSEKVSYSITFNDTNNTVFNFNFKDNGLYVMKKTIMASKITITTTSAYIGRFAAGIGCNIPTTIAKEPSFKSTASPRVTLSGQVISGAGGHNYRAIALDSRYKITREIMNEFDAGYKYIGMGYPFFLDLTDESYKLPFDKFYANEKDQQSTTFQSGIKRFLYSYRFEFEERF